jgi:hypothetical protein
MIRVCQFLVDNGIITKAQLDETLSMQNDNPERHFGEILVTLGILSKEELIMAMEMYMMATGSDPNVVDEWLDQDEVDMLLDKINENGDSSTES